MKMKFNWKVVVALVVLMGTVIWGIETLRPRLYSGTDVEFSVSNGSVQVTNSSDELLPVMLVGTGTRSFKLSNTTLDVSSSSVREGSGKNTTQTLLFTLPTGNSEFTVVNGKNIQFISNSSTPIDATVNLLTTDEFRDRLMLIVIVILGSLFALSSINDHHWISASRRRKAQEQADAQEENRQTFKRMFGK